MRGIWFLSTLALKQNQPDTALDILTNAKPTAVGKNIQVHFLNFFPNLTITLFNI